MGLIERSAERAQLKSFPGETLAEQLVNGRNAALAILRSYKPDLTFDTDGARTTFRNVDAWAERNASDLDAVMADSKAEALPEKVRVAFDAKTAQDFIIAGFTLAAMDLGPWTSGAITTAVPAKWALDDAQARLRVFASVVQLHESGYLGTLFGKGATSGFGAVPVAIVVAIAVTTVLLAAVIATYLYSTKQLEANHRVMAEICAKAQQSGDEDTVRACLNASKDLQAGADPFGFRSAIGAVVIGAVTVGALYLMFKFAPWDKLQKRAAG